MKLLSFASFTVSLLSFIIGSSQAQLTTLCDTFVLYDSNLYASCKAIDGTIKYPTLDLNLCLMNYNGSLAAQA